jgi:hypothetical protein
MTREEILQMPKDELFEESTVIQAFEEESQIKRQILINALVERAKEFKASREMQSLIRAFKNEIRAATNTSEKNRMTDFGYPDGEMYCGSWIADMNGIYVPTLIGDKLACYHPILPIARLKNMETDTEKIVLAFYRDNDWHEIPVDRSVIISASKILKLGDYGIMVTSETAKALVQFLADVEHRNPLPLNYSTSKFGWNKQDFIPFDKQIVFDEESRFKEMYNSLRVCGSYEIWMELVKKIRQNDKHYEPRVYMAASFGSVLVSQLNMLPFIVNIYGKTGGGKTVSMMVAASIWADPGENRYITDSYATQNAFEIRLDILNHLPLMIDDFSKIRDRMGDNFTDLIYLICSGKGKDRSNIDLGLNKTKTWSNVTLSNMERPLANETMRGGAINRILDFQMEQGDIFDNGNAVVEVIKDNFGFAGYKFIELIKELGVPAIKELRKDFEKQIKEEAKKQGSDKEEKQILPLSLILTADKLATDYIFKDGIYLDLPYMVSQLKSVLDISEGLKAYNILMDYYEMYKGKFSDKNEYNYEAWGFKEDAYLNIIPTVLNRIAKEQNFSPKILCEFCKSKKLLKTNNEKNQNVIKIDGITKRFYTIKIGYDEEFGVNTEENGFQDASGMELPFD